MPIESPQPDTHYCPSTDGQTAALEVRLRESERLALVGRITASVMHEINNPAEAVTNLVYLISENTDNPEMVAALAAQIEEQMVRIRYVARQTLSYFRDRPQKQSIDIVPLIETAIRFHEPLLHSKKIRFRKQIPLTLIADVYPGDYLQLVSNLLSNAIDAVAVGGMLRVRLRPFQDNIRLTVADNGCGIPHSIRTHLFEPFQTSKAERGNGLGLWICRSVAEKHGGHLCWHSSTSEKAHGTTLSASIAA